MAVLCFLSVCYSRPTCRLTRMATPTKAPDLAFNTALSFLTNTNLQDYSGESAALLTYTQHFVLYVTFLHFCKRSNRPVAAMMVIFKAMKDRVTDKLGNFWDFFLVKSITRLFLPLSYCCR